MCRPDYLTQMEERITDASVGEAFIPSDFLDIADRTTILQRFDFIFCAAEINKSSRDRISAELTPRAFSFLVFLFQTLMPLLRFPPQIIGDQYLPLGIRDAQRQPHHFSGKYLSGSNLKSRAASRCHILGPSASLILPAS